MRHGYHFFYEPLSAHKFFSFLILLHSLMSHLLKTYLERDHTFRTWSIYFVANEWHVFAYFQCRSSTYMWCVCDLNLGIMISLSTRATRLDKTQHKASSLYRKLISWKIIYGFCTNYHHWGTKRFFIIFKNKTPILILIWNNIIAALVLLFHISQQLRLCYSTCIPQSFRFMMVSYELSNPN